MREAACSRLRDAHRGGAQTTIHEAVTLRRHLAQANRAGLECYHFGRHWIRRWTFPWITKLVEGILTALHARGEAPGG
jgi:hypothetical protein